jgi:hypothetical protein
LSRASASWPLIKVTGPDTCFYRSLEIVKSRLYNFLICDIIHFEGLDLARNDWDTRMDYVSKGVVAFREIWSHILPLDAEFRRASAVCQRECAAFNRQNHIHVIKYAGTLYIAARMSYSKERKDEYVDIPVAILYADDTCLKSLNQIGF